MSLWVSTTAPKVPLDDADGDEAESVRARFRERVSSPCGEDRQVETAGHPPGGVGCAALFPSSRCMEEKFLQKSYLAGKKNFFIIYEKNKKTLSMLLLIKR